MDIRKTLEEEILPLVNKPARYTGGEFNSYKPKPDRIQFALAFPDTYEVGMSHLGARIIYGMLNDTADISCQRVFAPLADMSAKLKEYNIPLYALESFKPLSEFDFIGFSLEYEMCLTTVLHMLDLAHIQLKAKDRGESDPIIIGGGPLTTNPKPFQDFFDLFVVGEAEPVLCELVRLKKTSADKRDYLNKASKLKGVYVPSVSTDKTERIFVRDVDGSYFPEKTIVPFVETIHDRVALEVMRGCPRGCRFCQAGAIYRPVRQKKVETVLNQARKLLGATGYEEASLLSLSSTDYAGCYDTITAINEEFADKRVNVSLPSLRIDRFSLEIAEAVKTIRTTSLTFAPEAGSQRMRDIINKNITEEEIFATLREAFTHGYSKIKLYFMIGLPYETDEDVIDIARLADKINKLYISLDLKPKFLTLSVSVACFVPKPHTAFQFCAQNTTAEFERKQKLLKDNMNRRIKFSYHHPKVSLIEGAFARGDERLNDVLLDAYKNGCVFDAWDDSFKPEAWDDAFAENGLTCEEFSCRKFEHDEALPWDIIDIGLDKEFFISEHIKATQEQVSKNCFEECNNCGISKRYGRCSFEI